MKTGALSRLEAGRRLHEAEAALSEAVTTVVEAASNAEESERQCAAAARAERMRMLGRCAEGMEKVVHATAMSAAYIALRRRCERRRRLRPLGRIAGLMARDKERTVMQDCFLCLRGNLALGRARVLCSLSDTEEPEADFRRMSTASSLSRASLVTAVSMPDSEQASEVASEAWSALNALRRVVLSHAKDPLAEDECKGASRRLDTAIAACDARLQERQQACVQLMQMSKVFERGVWTKTHELSSRDRAVKEMQGHISFLESELFRRANELQRRDIQADQSEILGDKSPEPTEPRGSQSPVATHNPSGVHRASPKRASTSSSVGSRGSSTSSLRGGLSGPGLPSLHSPMPNTQSVLQMQPVPQPVFQTQAPQPSFQQTQAPQPNFLVAGAGGAPVSSGLASYRERMMARQAAGGAC